MGVYDFPNFPLTLLTFTFQGADGGGGANPIPVPGILQTDVILAVTPGGAHGLNNNGAVQPNSIFATGVSDGVIVQAAAANLSGNTYKALVARLL